MTQTLRLDGLTKSYGMLNAVDGVTLEIPPGSRHALIGPNGAGKSTLFKIVTGEIAPTAGRLHFGGDDISKRSQPHRARLGICQTYQHSSVFLNLSLTENVALAARRTLGHGSEWWRPARRVSGVDELVAESLEAVGLLARSADLPVALSHGERRQLELAIVLAARPSVLLLDEPTAGMSAAESLDFVHLVRALPEELTIVIVEHDLDVVFELATQISVLHLGKLIATGTPEEVTAHQGVQDAYLSWMPTDVDSDLPWSAKEAR